MDEKQNAPSHDDSLLSGDDSAQELRSSGRSRSSTGQRVVTALALIAVLLPGLVLGAVPMSQAFRSPDKTRTKAPALSVRLASGPALRPGPIVEETSIPHPTRTMEPPIEPTAVPDPSPTPGSYTYDRIESDLLIRASDASSWIGRDVKSLDGTGTNQEAQQGAGIGDSVTFDVRFLRGGTGRWEHSGFSNEGQFQPHDLDSAVLKGSASSDGWTVHYYDEGGDDSDQGGRTTHQDITAAMISGSGWTVPEQSMVYGNDFNPDHNHYQPGRNIRIQLTPGASVTPGTSPAWSTLLRLFSDAGNSSNPNRVMDAVIATGTPQSTPLTPTATSTPTTGLTVTPTPEPTATPVSYQAGLNASYFLSGYGTHQLASQEIVPNIDFNWGSGSPNTDVWPDYWYAHFEGYITAPYTGEVEFQTLSDDGVALSVNNQWVISNWTNHLPVTNSGKIQMIQGQRVPISCEYFDTNSAAQLTLSWRWPGQGMVTVPTTALSHTTTPTSPAVTLSQDAIRSGNFEFPNVGSSTFHYLCLPGSEWNFQAHAGIASNSSAFNNGYSPQGSQVAFLQLQGSMQQTVSMSAGAHRLRFYAVVRGGLTDDFVVKVDGTVVGQFTQSNSPSAGYQLLATPAFTVTAGNHEVSLSNLASLGGDRTVFIDQVQLVPDVVPVDAKWFA